MPALGVGVVVALLTALGAGFAPAAVKRAAADESPGSRKATAVSVTLGEPSELGFTLSKSSLVPAGTIKFTVKNMGVAYHDFKLCTKSLASAGAATNACAGKKTAILKPGQSATLTLTVAKSGKYEFLCSVTGHAAAGMKGLLGVGAVVTPAEQKRAASAGGSTPSISIPPPPPIVKPNAPGTTPEIGPTVGCPPGVTVKASGNTDADGDELGTEADDQDGCV